MTQPRHFLDLNEIALEDLRAMLKTAQELKAARPAPKAAPDAGAPLAGRMLAMIFERPSTRTRVSFDMAMRQLGGQTMFLSADELQLGRGETIGDTAKALSRYVDAILIRSDTPRKVREMAANATVPVINGLTPTSHPCQLMADILTYEEHRGDITGRKFAWVGDGNNVAASLIHAAGRFGFSLNCACPPDRRGKVEAAFAWAREVGADVTFADSPQEAVTGADCVMTDTWVSMDDEADLADLKHRLSGFQVNEALMDLAAPDGVFMHCLPAHRGEEVTDGVIDGPRSLVWDEVENRLHAQKGILNWCLGES